MTNDMALGDSVIDEDEEFTVVWDGAADKSGECFCLTSSRNTKSEPHLAPRYGHTRATYDTLAGEPFKPRGLSVARTKLNTSDA